MVTSTSCLLIVYLSATFILFFLSVAEVYKSNLALIVFFW